MQRRQIPLVSLQRGGHRQVMGIDWKQTYLSGSAPMDMEHQQWLDKANRFLRAGNALERLAAALELRDYTALHFRHEEDLMRQVQYPDTKAHIRSHAGTLIHMNLLFQQLQNGTLCMDKWEAFLEDLFTKHMGDADHKLAAYVSCHMRLRSG